MSSDPDRLAGVSQWYRLERAGAWDTILRAWWRLTHLPGAVFPVFAYFSSHLRAFGLKARGQLSCGTSLRAFHLPRDPFLGLHHRSPDPLKGRSVRKVHSAHLAITLISLLFTIVVMFSPRSFIVAPLDVLRSPAAPDLLCVMFLRRSGSVPMARLREEARSLHRGQQ